MIITGMHATKKLVNDVTENVSSAVYGLKMICNNMAVATDNNSVGHVSQLSVIAVRL